MFECLLGMRCVVVKLVVYLVVGLLLMLFLVGVEIDGCVLCRFVVEWLGVNVVVGLLWCGVVVIYCLYVGDVFFCDVLVKGLLSGGVEW